MTARRSLKPAERALFVAACLLAAAVSVLGLLSSFTALEEKAREWGWEWPWMLPSGIDLSIPAFTLAGLLLIRVDMPLVWVAWVPRLLTGVTVYLNWESSTILPGQVGHAALTLLWVVFSEIAGHVYASYISEENGARIEKIRRIRWMLSPISTAVMWRYMRLWETTDYSTVVAARREATVFRARMRAQHGRRWRRRPELATEQLALKLSRHGVPIQETLDAPAKAAEEARRAEEERREVARREAEERREQQRAEEQRLKQEREEQERRDAERAEEAWRRGLEQRRLEEERERQQRIADAEAEARLVEIQRAQQQAEEQARAEAWRREQERRRAEAEAERQRKDAEAAHAERLAQAARDRVEAMRAEREEADRKRAAEAQQRQLAATVAPDRGATTTAATAPRRPPQTPATGRHSDRRDGATATATDGATKAPRKAPAKRSRGATRGEAEDAIRALYDSLGRRPTEGEMTAELERIKSPYTSRQFAQKLRAEIESSNPKLAALGTENVRPFEKTGS